jgi:hypothetical protein
MGGWLTVTPTLFLLCINIESGAAAPKKNKSVDIDG